MNSIEANLLYRRLKADSNISNEAIIQSLIEADLNSIERKRKLNGENYYDCENDIKNIPDYENQEKTHKVPNGFLKKIIEQKVNYCLGNDITFEGVPDSIDFDINDFIDELAIESSKKGISWLYLFIDEKIGKLNYKIIDSLECIPIYDTEFEDELLQMIRYYRIEVIENGIKQYRYKVEVYDNEKVTYYMQQENLSYSLDFSMVNPSFYNQVNRMQVGNIVETINTGWSSLPFIALLNNSKALTDLNNIKGLIDLYDKVFSDYANNIEAHQDSILVIVDRGHQDLPALKKMIKEEKIICVDDVSGMEGVKYLTLEMPIEARKELLKETRKNIYEFSLSVDKDQLLNIGGNVPQIYIDAMFEDLSLKGTGTIKMIKRFLKNLFTFYNQYAKLTNKEQINFDNYKAIILPKKLRNESEQIKNSTDSVGTISDRTRLINDPRVTDIDEELTELEKDKTMIQDTLNNFNDDDENNNDDD